MTNLDHVNIFFKYFFYFQLGKRDQTHEVQDQNILNGCLVCYASSIVKMISEMFQPSIVSLASADPWKHYHTCIRATVPYVCSHFVWNWINLLEHVYFILFFKLKLIIIPVRYEWQIKNEYSKWFVLQLSVISYYKSF